MSDLRRHNDPSERLADFIKATTGVEVNDDSFLFDDLGINGLDSESFMIQFSEAFHVDLSGFDIRKYALSEYELGNIFLILYNGIFKRPERRIESFTVSHLYEVIELGEWFDPTREIAD